MGIHKLIFSETINILMQKRTCLILLASIIILSLLFILDIRWKVIIQPEPTLPPDIESYLDFLKKVDDSCLDVVYGNYCVHSIQGVAQRYNAALGSVTLCTHCTIDFLQHVSVLCKRWGGPISVAVYSPPLDYPTARATVDALMQCDFCIRHWVSWHFFYEKTPDTFIADNDFYDRLVPRNCDNAFRDSVKRRSKGTYPINVGRNLARRKSLTPYIFSLDIELYPSSGVLPKFERMLRSSSITTDDPQVWVLPVFEVYSNESAPDTKFELKKMFDRKQAISFHTFKCNICHLIPNLTQWLNHDALLKSEVSEFFEELKVLMTVQRTYTFGLENWEPFFIGTNKEPEFDIKLSWEGKRNKMQMAYEMCLKNYSYHIVDNAFLVHAPGVKAYNQEEENKRANYARINNRWLSLIKRDLIKTYGNNTDCQIQCR